MPFSPHFICIQILASPQLQTYYKLQIITNGKKCKKTGRFLNQRPVKVIKFYQAEA
jgi:hypothetical protein